MLPKLNFPSNFEIQTKMYLSGGSLEKGTLLLRPEAGGGGGGGCGPAAVCGGGGGGGGGGGEAEAFLGAGAEAGGFFFFPFRGGEGDFAGFDAGGGDGCLEVEKLRRLET